MAARDNGSAGHNGSPRSPVQQRLHDGYRTDRRYLSQMVGGAQNERSARMEAVLELKQDLDASSAKIGAQSSAIQARDQAEKAQQARMHQSLRDQGKNPCEVARRKMVEREARKERSKLERNIQEREAKLLAQLEAEKVVQRRREKVEAENCAYEKKYQREMGRAAQEERTNSYLLSRTGKETLDPTGKLDRVYPSQETTMKDHTFGLGHSAILTPEHRRRVVIKVLSKPTHTKTELSSMLLPRRRKRHSQQESEENESTIISSERSEGDQKEAAELKNVERLIMPPLPGMKPGQGLRKVNHALLPNSDVKLPPLSRTNSRRSQDPREEDDENQAIEETLMSTKLKKSRGRSVLEERQLAKARQRQKDSMFTQSQVVWGKTFSGNAFLANPQMLWFKDFDVGRPLTCGFTLTNVSNTFNQFRLLPMDEEVVELFDIVYERPGRMSAGMSCSLKMTFMGIEGRDLETALFVASPTGVCQIPVRCTCKKAVPILTQREVHFPEIVAGERTTVALTLANEGALPLEYRLHLRPPSPTEPVQPEPSPDVDMSAGQENADENEAAEPEHDNTIGVDTISGDNVDVNHDVNSRENPQEDNGEQPVEETVDSIDHFDPSMPTVSRAPSATSTKTSASQNGLPEAVAVEDKGDDNQDPLDPDEQELVDRVHEITLFKPEGADEPIRFTKRGVVAPYSSSAISFTFAPAAAMTLENQQFILGFPKASSPGISSPDLRRLASIPVFVSGVALQVPIFVAWPRLDFRCCAYGKLYRQQLVVCNRGKVALKIQVQVPKPLAGYVEFNPAFGFVQAAIAAQEGMYPVQVKFRPEESMWKRIERARFGSRELGMLAVPVQVVVPDQVVPVFFLLTARLTPTVLQLNIQLNIQTASSDGGMHFGACSVGNSVSHELTITNSARVPQRVGVTSLPKDVTISDVSEGGGFILLSGEARTLRVVYTPSFPGVLKAGGVMGRAKPMLALWSSTFKKEYTVLCSGSGVASDVAFSHSAVRIGATSLGQMQTCNVNLINQSDRHTHVVELRLPPEAEPFLGVTPLVARLGPRETIRLEIDFKPTDDIFKLAKNCYFEAKTPDHSSPVSDEPMLSARSVHADMSAERSTEEPLSNRPAEDSEPTSVTPKSDAEPRSCHHAWAILCFHQQEGSAGDKHSLETQTRAPLQALEVRTTVVEPFLIPSTTTLDFGQVAIGQSLVRDLTLETVPYTTNSVLLQAQPLHILGAFRLIGALREIPPSSDNRKKRAIRVEFEPRIPLMYEDELEMSALGVNIRVQLRGEGINPSLSLNPADGKLDFKDVLARTRNVRELTLSNGSAFPLAYSIVALDSSKQANVDPGVKEGGSNTTSTGLPTFTFSPIEAIIPENGSIIVQVVFQPDHQRPGHYSGRYRIKVPNESEQHIISVSGRCWENQLYVFAPTADASSSPIQTTGSGTVETRKLSLLTPKPVEDLFDLPPSVSLSQLPPSMGVNDLPAAGLRKPAASFTLTFAGNEDVIEGTKITKTLFIGSTTPSSGVYGGLDEINTTAPANAAGSAGTFDLVLDAASPHAKFFTLEPARGAIAAGQQLAIQVTYDPPTPTLPSASSAQPIQRRPDLEVVQWVQVRVQCTLKGGSLWRTVPMTGGTSTPVVPPTAQKGANAVAGSVPDGADSRMVMVILRGRIQT